MESIYQYLCAFLNNKKVSKKKKWDLAILEKKNLLMKISLPNHVSSLNL